MPAEKGGLNFARVRYVYYDSVAIYFIYSIYPYTI